MIYYEKNIFTCSHRGSRDGCWRLREGAQGRNQWGGVEFNSSFAPIRFNVVSSALSTKSVTETNYSSLCTAGESTGIPIRLFHSEESLYYSEEDGGWNSDGDGETDVLLFSDVLKHDDSTPEWYTLSEHYWPRRQTPPSPATNGDTFTTFGSRIGVFSFYPSDLFHETSDYRHFSTNTLSMSSIQDYVLAGSEKYIGNGSSYLSSSIDLVYNHINRRLGVVNIKGSNVSNLSFIVRKVDVWIPEHVVFTYNVYDGLETLASDYYWHSLFDGSLPVSNSSYTSLPSSDLLVFDDASGDYKLRLVYDIYENSAYLGSYSCQGDLYLAQGKITTANCILSDYEGSLSNLSKNVTVPNWSPESRQVPWD